MINIIEEQYVRLTDENIFMIDFIRSSIEEEVSRGRLLEALLEEGMGLAITKQHKDGQLTPDALAFALNLLPDDLKELVLEHISSTTPSN